MFRLFYSVESLGDGSAMPHFHLTQANADKAADGYYQGFGSDSVGSVEFAIEDGKLLFRHTGQVWHEVPSQLVRARKPNVQS